VAHGTYLKPGDRLEATIRSIGTVGTYHPLVNAHRKPAVKSCRS
jgi:hypothetical protein